ncbi:MAG: hypothetical protein R2747_07070 [Pyrinomonadaceae bacterium]
MSQKNPFIRTLELCFLFTAFSLISFSQTGAENALLRGFDSEGREKGFCRLIGSTVDSETNEGLTRITVTQTFENPFSEKVGGIYSFSLPPTAVAGDVSISIDGRPVPPETGLKTVEKVEEKLRAGPVGRILSQRIGDILPRSEIRIVISYFERSSKKSPTFPDPDPKFYESLPLSAASQPSANPAPNPNSGGSTPANPSFISSYGQSSGSNQISVDDMWANLGLGADETSFSRNAGAVPTVTASGGTNAVLDLSATSEVKVRSYGKASEQRVTGSQVDFISRSGTNQFHGQIFEQLGNEAVNANASQANARGLERAATRENLFGAALGGYIVPGRAWFFASYEGLRLRQPGFGISEVPETVLRQTAAPEIRPLLNAFPLANGPSTTAGLAEFSATYTNPAANDIFGLRIDLQPNSDLRIGGRVNLADSKAGVRGAPGFSLNTIRQNDFENKSLTLWSTYVITPVLVMFSTVNFSRNQLNQNFFNDEFGGATPLPSDQLSASDFYKYDLAGKNSAFGRGRNSSEVRQFQARTAFNWVAGDHNFTFGGSYRRLDLRIAPSPLERSVLFSGVNPDGIAERIFEMFRPERPEPKLENLSFFAQHNWRAHHKLNLNFGLRWDSDFAPAVEDGGAGVPGFSPQMPDQKNNLAPRVSFSYNADESGYTTLRGGVGLYYDFGNAPASEVFANSFPYAEGNIARNVHFSTTPATPVNPLLGFADDLKTPRVWHFFAEIQQRLPGNQSLTATYSGSVGRDLFRTRTVNGAEPGFNFQRLTDNSGQSSYNGFQLMFERRYGKGLAFNARYNFSKSIDNYSPDLLRQNNLVSTDPSADRAVSDFDIKHSLSLYGVYRVPTPFTNPYLFYLTKNWSVSAVGFARTGLPVNVTYARITDLGMELRRPDPTADAPVYREINGIKAINPAAFTIPNEDRQGYLGRNTLRGFPFFQLDASLFRRITLTRNVSLNLGVNAYNVLNRVNLADMSGNLGTRFSGGNFLTNTYFGRTTSTYGGNDFTPYYLYGGPRTIQFSVKIAF